MKRKITGLSLCAIMTFCCSSYAFATNTSVDANSIQETEGNTTEYAVSDNLLLPVEQVGLPITCSNEIDDVLWAREATAREIKKAGLSDSQVEELSETNIEKLFLERAQLPESELRAYGYADNEINILKAYDGSEITPSSSILAAAAKCTGSLKAVSASTSKYQFQYTWNWNHKPLYTSEDKVAITWAAFNSKSAHIDCSNVQTTKLKYYWTTDGKYYKTKSAKASTESSFTGCSTKFQLLTSKLRPDGNQGAIWVKTGTTTVTLGKEKAAISYIKFSGGYAHRKRLYSGTISVSLFDPLSSSFSFFPPEKVQTMNQKTAKLTSKGKFTYI